MANTHLPGLDAVRIAATLTILLYHFEAETATAGLAPPPVLGPCAQIAIWALFLLSGAALAWQGRDEMRLSAYFRRRAAAIYPAFWLVFFPLFLYSDVLHANNAAVPRWKLVFSVLGLDGYAQSFTATYYKIGEWFLGCLILLYLLFPLLLRLRNSRVCAAVLAVLWFAWPQVCPAGIDPNHTLLGTLPVFALGVFFGGRLKAASFGGGLLFAAVALFAALLPLPARGTLLLAAVASFWVLFACGQRLCGRAARVAAVLAKNCYGTFLVHHVLLTLVLLPAMRRAACPLLYWLGIYLAAALALGAALRLLSGPLSRAIAHASQLK